MLTTFEKILAITAAHYGITLRPREASEQPKQHVPTRQELVAA